MKVANFVKIGYQSTIIVLIRRLRNNHELLGIKNGRPFSISIVTLTVWGLTFNVDKFTMYAIYYGKLLVTYVYNTRLRHTVPLMITGT